MSILLSTRELRKQGFGGRIFTYLYMNKCKKGERIFTMSRQTVNRHIKAAVAKAGGAPFPISCHIA